MTFVRKMNNMNNDEKKLKYFYSNLLLPNGKKRGKVKIK